MIFVTWCPGFQQGKEPACIYIYTARAKALTYVYPCYWLGARSRLLVVHRRVGSAKTLPLRTMNQNICTVYALTFNRTDPSISVQIGIMVLVTIFKNKNAQKAPAVLVRRQLIDTTKKKIIVFFFCPFFFKTKTGVSPKWGYVYIYHTRNTFGGGGGRKTAHTPTR